MFKHINGVWQYGSYRQVYWRMDPPTHDLQPITGAESSELLEILNHMRDARIKELAAMLKKEFAFLIAAGFEPGQWHARMDEQPRWISVDYSYGRHTITCRCEVFLYRPISRRNQDNNLVTWILTPGPIGTFNELIHHWRQDNIMTIDH
jgi:hypothetical protein